MPLKYHSKIKTNKCLSVGIDFLVCTHSLDVQTSKEKITANGVHKKEKEKYLLDQKK